MSMTDERPGPLPGDAPDVTEDKKVPAPASDGDKQPDATEVESEKPESSTDSAENESSGDETTAEAKRPKAGLQKRLDELTRDKHEAARRADEALNRVAELERKLAEAKAPPANTSQDQEPTPDAYPSWEAYEKAQRRWIIDQATKAAKISLLEEQKRDADARSQEESRTKFNDARKRFDDRALEIAPEYEGLDKAIKNLFGNKIPLNDAMAEYIFEGSDKGPEVVFYLDAHPAEAADIAKLTPIKAAAAMARLESKLAETTEKRVSGAPPPPKEVKGGKGSDTYDPEKASTEENIARWRKAANLRA